MPSIRLRSLPRFVELPHEPPRCDGSIRVLTKRLDFLPIDDSIEANANPTSMTNVRRTKVPIGIGSDEFRLNPVRRGAPKVWKVEVMVPVWPQLDELPPGEEGRRTMAFSLARARERKADGADARLDAQLRIDDMRAA